MKYTYWILITVQIAIIIQFIYFEQQVPGFVTVTYSDNPIPYDLLPSENAFFTASYLLVYALHLIIVEQIFKRRDNTIIWDKAGLRITIQIGFSILFYFLYVALFSNLQNRHLMQSVLTVEEFFHYRAIITAILVLPVVICLLLFKYHTWTKNTFILISIGFTFTLIISAIILYFEQGTMHGNLNDLEEERRIITNILPVDIAIGFIIWREAKRNARLDKLEKASKVI